MAMHQEQAMSIVSRLLDEIKQPGVDDGPMQLVIAHDDYEAIKFLLGAAGTPVLTVLEHERHARRILDGLGIGEVINGDEVEMILAHRFRKAAEAFIAQRGKPEAWGNLIALMCAYQRYRT